MSELMIEPKDGPADDFSCKGNYCRESHCEWCEIACEGEGAELHNLEPSDSRIKTFVCENCAPYCENCDTWHGVDEDHIFVEGE